MELMQTLEKAAQLVQASSLKNEAQVKQAIIVPILRSLSWDDSEPEEFLPEYQVDNGQVDYALFAHRKPVVFVEAKRLGNLSPQGEAQLFGYAVNKGIPLLVLTDGHTWDFYLSMAAGEPSDRRFCRIELGGSTSNRLSQFEDSFSKYLERERVISGQARQDAEAHLEDNKRLSRAKDDIPQA